MKTTEPTSTSVAATQKKQSPFFGKGSNALFSSEMKNEQSSFFSGGKNSFFKTQRGNIQTKLTIGQPGDIYEKEADAMADKVVQRLSEDHSFFEKRDANTIQKTTIAPASSITPLVQTRCASCEQEEKLQKKEEDEEKGLMEEKLQKKPIFESNAESPDDEKNIRRKCSECGKDEKLQMKLGLSGSPTASPGIESNLNSSKGGGSPISATTREQMETAFGVDFSKVRIHNDHSAVQTNKDLNAQAFTHGNDIYFNEGKYNTNSTSGKHLLAHELTHVVQQKRATEKIQRFEDCRASSPCPVREPGELSAANSRPLRVDNVRGAAVGLLISNFASGSAGLKGGLNSNANWASFWGYMVTHPNITWRILGFTDCQGNEANNRLLRWQRAIAVNNELPLYARHQVEAFEAAEPRECIAENNTAANRTLNRSVLIMISQESIEFPPETITVPVPPRACFDGTIITVRKNGMTGSCAAVTGNIGSPTPVGRFCVRPQGVAQVRGGIRGRFFQDRSRWYLIEPQFSTARSRMQLHPGTFSEGCITVTDTPCFSRIASVLNAPGTVSGTGYDGYPPGNSDGVVKGPRAITCVAWLDVVSPGGCGIAPASTSTESLPRDAGVEDIHGVPQPTLQRKCAACEKDEKPQKKPDSSGSPIVLSHIESVLNSSKSGGSPIPATTKEQMENSFSADFSDVRIHDDRVAAQMNKDLNAQAFTHGSDIYFNSGNYDINSTWGQHLLAHELTHTIQQSSKSNVLNFTSLNRKIIQYQLIPQRSGNSVGVNPSQNIREEVLNTLDRLHELWSITNENYGTEYPIVHAYPQGANIQPSQIPNTIASVRRNEQPHIHPLVARNFLAVNFSNTVGTGMINNKADVLLLQRILNAHSLLAQPDFAAESASVTSLTTLTIPDSVMPKTFLALTALKQRIAGGLMGWGPIRADELRYGPQDDKFGARTFQHNQFSIFIPSGASTTPANNVHVFFSPGSAQGESGFNAVLQHGLRGASDSSQWILIGVPGAEPGFVTISSQQIIDCLSFVGRAPQINSLRLSAHSRGYRGLKETIRRGLVTISLINRVVIFDANYRDISTVLSSSGIPPSKVIAYDINSGILPLAGSTTHSLSPQCMRAIGYCRLIQDAMVTMPNLVIPSPIRSQLLTLPVRGRFTTNPAPIPPAVNITEYCRTNAPAINNIIRDENHRTKGLKTFLDMNNLGRFTDLNTGQQSVFSAGVYSHHFFVSELAHEVTD